MPALLAVLTAFLLITAPSALAQDALFSIPELSPIERLLAPEDESETPHTGQEALDLYLKNCGAQQHPTLDEEALLSQCLCTASRLEERFQPAQILAMFGTGKKAQTLRDQELTRAFSPCMADTIYNIALRECNDSRQIRRSMHNQKPVCLCMAQGMRATLARKAEWITGQYIAFDKDKAPDPLARYMQSGALGDDMDYRLSVCLQWYEYSAPSSNSKAGQGAPP